MRKFMLSFLLFLLSVSFLNAKETGNLNRLNYTSFLSFPSTQAGSKIVNFTPPQSSVSSTGKAFLKSLLLPGWGEFSSGAKKRARYLLVTEGVLWTTFVSLQIYGHWKQSDMENYAMEKAQVNTTGKDNTFYANVSNYHNIYDYNEEKRQFRQYSLVYSVDEDHFWQWDSDADSRRFDQLYTSRKLAGRNATLLIGGILLNHIFSAIDAVWVRHKANQKLSSSLQATPFLTQSGALSLKLQFSMNW